MGDDVYEGPYNALDGATVAQVSVNCGGGDGGRATTCGVRVEVLSGRVRGANGEHKLAAAKGFLNPGEAPKPITSH